MQEELYTRKMNNLRNTRYKRKKNMIKKSLEISSKCGLDIFIMVYNQKLNRIDEYHTSENFTISTAIEIL